MSKTQDEYNKQYKVLFRALELACEDLKSANITLDENTAFDFLNHKIHGTLIGYYLMKAEKDFELKER